MNTMNTMSTSSNGDRIRRLWPDIANHFDSTLALLADMGNDVGAAKGGKQRKLAYNKFWSREEQARKELRTSIGQIFGSDPNRMIPGEQGELDGSESSDSDDASPQGNEPSELKALGCHLWNWSKDIRMELDLHFDDETAVFDPVEFKNILEALLENLKETVDDIRGDFAEHLG